jgi:hypothetical protein
VRFVWVVALAACGRVGFDARSDASSGAPSDAPGAVDVSADALPADLIAYFPLDGDLTDLVGGPAGTCTTCPTPVAGHRGMAMHFDGAAACVTIADVGQLSPANLTISIWANEDSPLGMRECQVSKRVDVGGTPYDSWQLETTATVTEESFTSNHGGPGNDQITADNVITAGAWHHFVATYDGFNEQIYVDGALVNGAGNSAQLNYDTNPAVIGCDDNAGFSEHFLGALDELRIYNRALSAAEVQALP